MKKIFWNITATIAFFAFIINPSVSKAQTSFGVKGGLNATNLSVDNLPNKKEKLGFNISVFSDINVMDNFIAFQPEISYSAQGTRYKVGNQTRNLGLDYINLHTPLAFKLSNFDLQYGPYVSYLVSSKDYKSLDETQIAVNAFKQFDFGVSGGINMNIDRFVVGLRYNQGLIDITKDNVKPFIGSGKNAAGQLTVGYRF